MRSSPAAALPPSIAYHSGMLRPPGDTLTLKMHSMRSTSCTPQRPPGAGLWRSGALLLAAVAALMAGGCASGDRSRSGLFEPYRIEIPQGNYVDQTMLRQVKPGMSREQVRFALGTPLLNDSFRTDRWEYVFTFKHPNGNTDRRRASVLFDDANKVASVQADSIPDVDEGNDPALPGYRRKQGRFR